MILFLFYFLMLQALYLVAHLSIKAKSNENKMFFITILPLYYLILLILVFPHLGNLFDMSHDEYQVDFALVGSAFLVFGFSIWGVVQAIQAKEEGNRPMVIFGCFQAATIIFPPITYALLTLFGVVLLVRKAIRFIVVRRLG